MAVEGINPKMEKVALILTTITFSALFSYFFAITLSILPQVAVGLTNVNILQAAFTLITAISLVLASFKINKHNSLRIAISSLIIIVAVTFMILVVPWNEAKILLVFFTSIIFSTASLGVLTHFWVHTQSQKRGRFGGLIALFTVLLYFITSLVLAQDTTLVYSVIIAIVPIVLALAITLFYVFYAKVRLRPIVFNERNYYPEKRTVVLYSITWILFCFINGTISKNIDLPSAQMVSSQFVLVAVIQALSSVIGAFAGGEISDIFGRRPSLILSVALYGLSMAFSGFTHDIGILFFAFGLEGLSWGILLTLYGLVIWGDLANKENCARMYAIGLSTYVAFLGVGLFPSFLTQIPPAASALIGCSVIFLANLPIALAPELLTSEDRKNRKMHGYIRRVKRIADNQN